MNVSVMLLTFELTNHMTKNYLIYSFKYDRCNKQLTRPSSKTNKK